MTLRGRILLASAFLVVLPLILMAALIRTEMSKRLSDQYEARVDTLLELIQEDFVLHNRMIHERLVALKRELSNDNRFRAAVVQNLIDERRFLRGYAKTRMDLQGLSMIQIQDRSGAILSSGHFPGEMDRVEPWLPKLLASSPARGTLAWARLPNGTSFLALAAVDSLKLGGRTFSLVGGVAIDHKFLARLVQGTDLAISLIYPGDAPPADGIVGMTLAMPAEGDARLKPNRAGVFSSDSVMASILAGGIRFIQDEMIVPVSRRGHFCRQLSIPFILAGPSEGHLEAATLLVTSPREPLNRLRRDLDLWLAIVLLASAGGSLMLAAWLSARITRPLGRLTEKTAELDLDNLNVSFGESCRRDEVGILARFLDRMTVRLRASAERVREVERQATLGEVARQVNHDIKNGLVPIRNVLRHLTQVSQENAPQLAGVFQERKAVLESSISYLEALAANYAKLSHLPAREPCDLNEIVHEVALAMSSRAGIIIEEDLGADLALVLAEKTALRRIVENLVRNACESFGEKDGEIAVHTLDASNERGIPGVRLAVSDTGPGIPKETLARIFDDFYTTKKTGAGLGLSIVRRLASDFGGTVRARSELGKGTCFTVWFPAAQA
ncbi:MAG: HAMP domain-containing histidine kinase [Candidatus Eisenbacteria sp.]|nr:HAMP domain-containing histidine kinase [Candidatus Eisenbacteria bacterium]